MRVLYVNHTGQLGGAEQSLLDLLAALPSRVEPLVACPAGPFAEALSSLGVPVAKLPRSELSLRATPGSVARALRSGFHAAYVLKRTERRTRPALVHANSVRAGLLALPAARLVVHVRDCLPRTATANLVRRAIQTRAALVVANSQYTAASFRETDSGAHVRTIYNSVDTERFDPAAVTRREARRSLGLDNDAHVLGVVAQITPWKAQDDAIRVLHLLRARVPEVRLLIAGHVKFAGGAASAENESYAASLHCLARELGVARDVLFVGDQGDVPRVLRALDLLLVPSWEEPFGRSVVEAMAMELPVLATNVGGPAEVVTDGEDGRLLPPRSPAVWAEAAAQLLGDERLRTTMGGRARETVKRRFSARVQSEAVVSAYEEVLERASTGRIKLGASR